MRPSKPPSERRDRAVRIYCTASEEKRISRVAERSCLDTRTWLRKTIFEAVEREECPIPEDFRRELRRLVSEELAAKH